MNKKTNHSQLILLKVLTLIFIVVISFVIVTDVMAQADDGDRRDEGVVKRILKLIFENAGSAPVEEDYQGNKDCIDTSNGGGGTGSADENYTGNIDTSFDYLSYGLEAPSESSVNQWYSKLTGNNAYWATRLLKSEKLLISKGVSVKPYLTTAWMWFEYKNSLTPYLINCNDNRPGFTSEVSAFCSATNFQVAGYQAAYRATGSKSYESMFKTCYGDSGSVPSVLNDVVNNSDKAGVAKWSYLDASQRSKPGLVKDLIGGINSVTLDKISPRSSFSTPATQFYSLMLGKDPCIAVGLNSAAVSDGDLIRGLKNSACTYGYICRDDKAILSGMIGALRKFDQANNGTDADSYFTSGPSPTPRPTCAPSNTGGNNGTPDPNVTQGPLGTANVANYVHYCQCNPKWREGEPDDNICQAGCGLNTISSALTTLGQTTTPNQLRNRWESAIWSGTGMHTTQQALRDITNEKDSKFHWDGNDLTEGGRLNVQRAKFYFTGNNTNKCILIGSNSDINHIFAISGVNDDGTITVHDSWLGCNPGSTSEKVSYRRQNPSYANYYALPLCRN